MELNELRTNKQELISKYELIKNSYNFGTVATDSIISDLKRLDEPRKVKVKKFVADWIKYCKQTGVNLYNALEMGDLYFYNYANQKDDLKLKEFFETDTNQELFARAWLDGYEVEKEKRYSVKVDAPFGQYLGRYYINNDELTPQFKRTKFADHEIPTFTQKELKETGFSWVFDCPGIDIEEVK